MFCCTRTVFHWEGHFGSYLILVGGISVFSALFSFPASGRHFSCLPYTYLCSIGVLPALVLHGRIESRARAFHSVLSTIALYSSAPKNEGQGD